MKNVKKLLVLLMAFVMVLCMSAMVFAEENTEAPSGKDPVAGITIPFGVYEPTETELYASERVTILCEKVHVAHTIVAEIKFTSANYTEVKIGDVTYMPYTNSEANTATFMLPVELGEPLAFTAHTKAMGGKDIDYTVTVDLDKDNLKAVERGALQDGFYTTEINTNKAAYGWKLDKNNNLQEGFSYPSKDYTFPLTIQVQDGKIVDVAYTTDIFSIIANSGSDINYLMWAMDGHTVSDKCYQSKTVSNGETYHISPAPEKNGTGMKEQFVGKTDIAGVDSVSGATLTSRVIIEAVDQNLTKAERGQKDDPEPVLPTEDTSEDVIPEDGIYTAKGDCIGADLDDEKDILLSVEDGKINLELLYVQQRAATYPYIFCGTEAEALAAGKTAWPVPEDYDYGYKYPGTMYKDIQIKSLDKPQLFVMYAKSSDTWFNRYITISSETLEKKTAEEAAAIEQSADRENAVYSANTSLTSANALATKYLSEETKAAVSAAVEKLNQLIADTSSTADQIKAAQAELDSVVSNAGKEALQTAKDTALAELEKYNSYSLNDAEKAALDSVLDDAKAAVEAAKTVEAVETAKDSVAAAVYAESEDVNVYYDKSGSETILGMFRVMKYRSSVVGKDGKLIVTITNKPMATKYNKIAFVTGDKTDAEKDAAAIDGVVTGPDVDGKYMTSFTFEIDPADVDKDLFISFNSTNSSGVTGWGTNATYRVKIHSTDAVKEQIKKAEEKPETIQPTVTKKANPMKVKAVKKTYKVKVLKKKAKTFKAVKVTGYKGKLTYVGKPVGKKAKKYLKFNKKTGKITVKKGAKKGKYVMKVTVKAAGNANYKAGKKTVKVVVKVKK